ncbi:DUF2059 domain-containing protein [Rugamonas aquatica]|uniref:DUF2059 domain-containing protein n=1 Tax=Rugamonas aquatica TaxID=2743357 RepID=A0A6A7MYR5_9BURK|nr:DUF2059 domain-containing protein [Rugamonas aquatica]MQA37892.1 DUF2059 domain-containing protein [Rugamonas aquatica]
MKKIVASIVAAFALAGAAPAFAQADAASEFAARDLFDAMNYRTLMAGVMKQMSQGIGTAMRSAAMEAINSDPKMTPEQKQKAVEKMEAELPPAISAMQEALSDPGLAEDIMVETIPLYARTYTGDELKQIAAFYRSPVGTKMLASMPGLMAEGMQIGQRVAMRRLGPMMQKLQEKQTAK